MSIVSVRGITLLICQPFMHITILHKSLLTFFGTIAKQSFKIDMCVCYKKGCALGERSFIYIISVILTETLSKAYY